MFSRMLPPALSNFHKVDKSIEQTFNIMQIRNKKQTEVQNAQLNTEKLLGKLLERDEERLLEEREDKKNLLE